ncbi:hypothetical protein KAR91_03245 [Candidatus Pacearchaeota archaeon]|nr:hypothetical protein [Candidatus Pacearchaeota archaeon]
MPDYKFSIKGVGLKVANNDKADSGDTTAAVINAKEKARVYGVSISADATLTGDVVVKLGSTQITPKIRNAITGGVHWLIPLSDNYIQGEDGENIVINNSVAEDISYSIYYIEVTS